MTQPTPPETPHFYKRAVASRIFTIDWAAIIPSGAQLTAATWTIPVPLSQAAAQHTAAGLAMVRIGGGRRGERYTVTCAVTLSDGQTDAYDIAITVT